MLRHCLGCLFILLGSAAPAQSQKPTSKYPIATPQALLQGIWATNRDENAEFWVKGNRLTYVEFPDQQLRYTITPTRLTISQVDGPCVCTIKKLTRDSLVYITPYGYVVRLYKRK